MMHELSFALVLLVICQFANGQKILPGQCKTPTKVYDFDVSRYLGLWYEYARYPHIFELGQKCSTAQYGLAGADVSVRNSAINEVNGKPANIGGTAKVLGPGILSVAFSIGGISSPQTNKPNYYVAGTDYVNYSLVLACVDLPFAHAQFAWCLTRERFPSAETIARCYAVLDANQVPRRYFQPTNHQGCPAVNG